MGLDAHVIPISAFVAGDYETSSSGPLGERKAGWIDRLAAKSRRGEGRLYVEWLREKLGPCPRWNEDGGLILTRALPVEDLHALRQCAAKDPRLFPHLLDHSDFQGFYLPYRFAEPIWIPDPRWEDHPWFAGKPDMQKTSVGSAVELREELDELKGCGLAAWSILDELVASCLTSNTPICFDG